MAFKPSKRTHHTLLREGLNLTPIMNIFIIIIPFLLLTAVFAKTAIIDIYLPQETQAETISDTNQPPDILTIKVNDKGYELGGIGKGLFVPKTSDDLNLGQLKAELIKLKDKYPEQEEVILLFDPHMQYDIVVKLMDTTRETVEVKDGKKTSRMLFPVVSLGGNQ